MSERIPTEYQEILDQLQSNVFLERLKDHLDGGTNMNEKDTSDLINLARLLQKQDGSSSIKREEIKKFLENESLYRSIRTLIKSQSKEE